MSQKGRVVANEWRDHALGSELLHIFEYKVEKNRQAVYPLPQVSRGERRMRHIVRSCHTQQKQGSPCWFVLREKYCWLVADDWFVLREKYCWLVADKPSEQGYHHLVRLTYQPPANSTFISEQTSHQQPASSTSLSEQTSMSHQPPAKRTGCMKTTC
jgi:hypothetical protein